MRISLLGHKDHGKSTLIGRLLYETHSFTKDRINEALAMSKSLGKDGLDYAFLLDSFEEEREGGFTLDTTRAQVRHDGAIYELIDVPGHKELVRNMVSGASLASAAILIVSAKEDEGLQDETKLHIYVAGLLGIKDLVVAVNKMDLRGYDEGAFNELAGKVRRTLGSFGFDTARIRFVPVSAAKGDNVATRSDAMSWYDGEPLLASLGRLGRGMGDAGADPGSLPLRLFVQDNYDGVIVGRVESGRLAIGQEVVLEPSGQQARVGKIHCAGKDVDSAAAGQNVGMTLLEKGEPCARDGPHGIKRGAVCCDSKGSVKRVRARVFCFGSAISQGDRLKITCATQEAGCEVAKIIESIDPCRESKGAGPIGVAGGGSIDIALDSPLVLDAFAKIPPTGRFVLSKEGRIIAAGVVL